MTLFDVIIVGLAGWRLASFLVYEDGPFDVFARLRERVLPPFGDPIEGFVPNLFTCMFCMGVWTSLLAYGIWELWQPPVFVLAAAAVVVLVEKVVRWSDYL